jgi:hypothetical protein
MTLLPTFAAFASALSVALACFPDDYFIAIIAPWSPGRAHAIVMHGDQVVYDPSFQKRRRYQKKGISIITLERMTFA